ncbi:MAG: outer membrane beta-barrel protein [Gammaproteobacteria bacterium]|jgi:opacity protein-like surface antigen|nr:outer membrane beta-barrel protein [Gammaproteobacteria bacterium]
MVIRNPMLWLCCAAVTLLSAGARAEGLTWQYLDARYQQPSDDSIRGGAATVSVEATDNWVVQGGASYVRLKESNPDLKVSQRRIDLSVGRVFDLGERVSLLASAGYTHLRYDVKVGTVDVDGRDHVGNAQLILRAALSQRLEAEGSIGLLFDDEDTSDALWNAGLRYRFTPAASVLLGANGIASDAFDGDDVLYEIGFRFELDGE